MIWFTSDWHCHHGNIIKYCHRNSILCDEDRKVLENNGGTWHVGNWKGAGSSNYKISPESVENMNREIVRLTNKYVKKNDTLINLGDFCKWDGNYIKNSARIRDQINCENLHFIMGNHDREQIRRAGIFNSVKDYDEFEFYGRHFTLCHYPFHVWNKSHRQSISLHGHVHSNKDSIYHPINSKKRRLDVGIDMAYSLLGEYRPFSATEVLQIIDSVEYNDKDMGPEENASH